MVIPSFRMGNDVIFGYDHIALLFNSTYNRGVRGSFLTIWGVVADSMMSRSTLVRTLFIWAIQRTYLMFLSLRGGGASIFGGASTIKQAWLMNKMLTITALINKIYTAKKRVYSLPKVCIHHQYTPPKSIIAYTRHPKGMHYQKS